MHIESLRPSRAPEGARCATHVELVAGDICDRCGDYLCAICRATVEPTHCETCHEQSGEMSFELTRHTVTLESVVSVAWGTFTQHWLPLSAAALGMYAVVFVLSFVGDILVLPFADSDAGPLIASGSSIVQQLVQMVLQLGLYGMCLDLALGRGLDLTRLLSQLGKVGKLAVQTVVLALCLMAAMLPILVATAALGQTAGFVAVAVALPALIYAGLGLVFAQVELAHDDDAGPVEALTRSWALAAGHRWKVLGAQLLSGVAMIVGMMMLCVGFFPAAAFTSMLTVCLFLALRNGSGLPAARRSR